MFSKTFKKFLKTFAKHLKTFFFPSAQVQAHTVQPFAKEDASKTITRRRRAPLLAGAFTGQWPKGPPDQQKVSMVEALGKAWS